MAGCTYDSPGTDTNITDDTTRIRHSISTLLQSDPNDILGAFRDGIRQMKTLSTSDRRNYWRVARIHGNTSWSCEHGNWLFLPWHRAFLYYFEEIVRELTGNQHFAVPYWNWTTNRTLPDIFGPDWAPGTTTPTPTAEPTNPLHYDYVDQSKVPSSVQIKDRTRTLSASDRIDSGVATLSKIQNIQQETNFFRYVGGQKGASSRRSWGAGRNENPPHNAIHGEVGGHMSGGDAAFDPVFWTHHSMIDCLWYDWNIERGNPNTSNSSWLNASLYTGSNDEKFVDATGNTVSSIDVLESLFMVLAYNYEDCVPRAGQQPTSTPVQDPETFLEEGADVELRLVDQFPLRRDQQVFVAEPVSAVVDVGIDRLAPYLADDGEKEGRLLLRLRDVDPPAYPANLRTRVFVDHPEVTREASRDTPRFADHIPFFVAAEDQPNLDLFVDLTETMRVLYREELLADDRPLSIQLVSVPTGDLASEGTYTIGKLDLAITRSIIDGQVVEY